MDRPALARAVTAFVEQHSSATEAAEALGVDRTWLWRLAHGKAGAVREPLFFQLCRRLNRKQVRAAFVAADALSRLDQYADYLDRALKHYGLVLWGLTEALTHPERYPVLFTARPSWGAPMGVERIKLILEGKPLPYPVSAARALEEAGFNLRALNPLGTAIIATVRRLQGGPYASQLTPLRSTLQQRWGRYSPETAAEFTLALARILAPLLPEAAIALRTELTKLEGAEEALALSRLFSRVDDSGVSLRLEELERRGLLAGYLGAAVRMELIRLDRPPVLLRVASK